MPRTKFKMPTHIDTKFKYIICPNMNCSGFMHDHLQCSISNTTIKLFPDENFKTCPHLDTAKLVVFCHYGHPIESTVNCSSWQRADCQVKDCHSSTFARMSNTIIRIPLDKYTEFLKLPKIHNHDRLKTNRSR